MLLKSPLEAGKLLSFGKIVIFPTETVWGMGANALDHAACKKIYNIKGRPSDNPLIVHLSSISDIPYWGQIDEALLQKLAPFIPGPLTIILKKRREELYSCGLDTIGLRVPQEPLAQEMIAHAKCPIAAPSANISGKPSNTRFLDVVDHFLDKVDAILEGPDALVGLESTVIDLSTNPPSYLRPGAISFEELKALIPDLTLHNEAIDTLRSPGMKYRHYAPKAKVHIRDSLDTVTKDPSSATIGFSPFADCPLTSNAHYARTLYSFFIDCDKRNINQIYCQTPKEGPLHRALLNRLQKAAQLI